MRWFRDELFFTAMVGIVTLLTYGMYTGMARGNPGNYERAIANVLVHEGGAHYTNHPADPGGPTKYGITLADLRIWRDRPVTAEDVKAMGEEEARAIYRRHYADMAHFDSLALGLDYVILDYAINAGVARAVGDFTRVLKIPFATVMTDEIVAISWILDKQALIQQMSNRRMDFQMGLAPRYDVFKTGWRRRIDSVNIIAMNMAGLPQHKGFFNTNDLVPRIGAGKAYGDENAI